MRIVSLIGISLLGSSFEAMNLCWVVICVVFYREFCGGTCTYRYCLVIFLYVHGLLAFGGFVVDFDLEPGVLLFSG